MKPKGFVVPGGYMGLTTSGKYQLFDTEKEYLEYVQEVSDDSSRSSKKVRRKERQDRC